MPDPGEAAAVAALRAARLLEGGADRPRTTRRWRGAMARAAARLHDDGAPWMDLRLPVVAALAELLDLDDEALIRCAAVMLSVEAGELGGARGAAPDR
jgi:hypothetical protein